MCRPFRAQIIVMYYPGRCPGLLCIALSGQKNALFFRMRPVPIGTTDNSLGFQPQAVELEPQFFNTRRLNIAHSRQVKASSHEHTFPRSAWERADNKYVRKNQSWT